MDHQDWEFHVIEKKNKTKGEKAVSKAIQDGKEVETVKKADHTNKASLNPKQVAKVLNEEEYKVETVSHEFKIALQQARNQKGLTQEKLAQLVNEKKSVIQDYENGKAIPNNSIISKLEHSLGVKLPRQKKKKQSKDEVEDD